MTHSTTHSTTHSDTELTRKRVGGVEPSLRPVPTHELELELEMELEVEKYTYHLTRDRLGSTPEPAR